MRLVVFGWGNDARGDDGLGPLLLARVARAAWADVTTVEDFQLQIEHALDLDGAEAALFLDAGKDTPAPFSFAEIGPERDESHTTHALAPEAVLDVYARSLGRPPPPAFTNADTPMVWAQRIVAIVSFNKKASSLISSRRKKQ